MADRVAKAGMDLITLPHHAEFLSERWLEEAQRFWRELPAPRKASLAGRPFSVSERFTDAPPHMKLPAEVASWTLRFDGEAASIARGFDEGADLHGRGRLPGGGLSRPVCGGRSVGRRGRDVAGSCGAVRRQRISHPRRA